MSKTWFNIFIIIMSFMLAIYYAIEGNVEKALLYLIFANSVIIIDKIDGRSD